MGKALKTLLALAVIAAVAGAGAFALSERGMLPGALSDAAEEAKATATNAALDMSGLKDRVRDTLEANRDGIAQATGLSGAEFDAAIDGLAIDSWKAAPLPADAQPAATYDDPGYVTVEAYGQTVTFQVPESAQAYLPYLASAQ